MNHLLGCFFAVVVLATPTAMSLQPTTRPSDVPKGQPSWMRLDRLPYQEPSHDAVEKHILMLQPGSCWFLSYPHPVTKVEYDRYVEKLREKHHFSLQQRQDYSLPNALPYPKALEDIPEVDRGVRLFLQIEPDADSSILRCAVVLSSSARPVWREVEHRVADIVPMLFAFFVDGKPVVALQGGISTEGGSKTSVELIPAGGGERRWSLRIDSESVQRLLPDKRPHLLTVAAVFSERQRMGFTGSDSLEFEQFFHDGYFAPPKGHEGPQVLVRSNVAEIRWTGKNWIGGEAKQ